MQSLLELLNLVFLILILGVGAVAILDVWARVWIFIKRPRKKW